MADETTPPAGGLQAVPDPDVAAFDDTPSVPAPDGAGADDAAFEDDELGASAAAAFGEGSGEDGEEPEGGFDRFDPPPPVTEPKVSARQQKLFDMGGFDGDPGVTPQNIIDEDAEIELTASLGTAEVPLKGGLVDPEQRVRLFVTAEYAGKVDVPVRDRETREIESWKVRAKFRPTRCESIESALRDENTGLLEIARRILRERGELVDRAA